MIEYNIRNFGATGNGKLDDSIFIQRAIDECSKNGGGRVVLPSGFTFMSGPITLCSNMELHVQNGCVLLANPSEDVYHESAFRSNRGEGTIWIGGNGISQVTITGGGVIDGNGCSFMGKELEDSFELKPIGEVDPRPHILTLVNCRGIKVHNINFKDAAYWGLHFIGCNDVLINNVTVRNNLKIRNGDGIDVDHCENVNISNCHVESGDDAICFKNRREYAEYGSCRDITVSNCTLVSASCAIKFGSENMDAIENVVINNCIIKDSNRGIGIQNRDEGTVSNVIISNIILDCRLYSDVWWGKAEPIYITVFPRASTNEKDGGIRFPKGANKGYAGRVSDITISNVKIVSENGIFIAADELGKINGIKLKDIDITISKKTDHKGGLYDCRPCEGASMIVDDTAGVYIKKAVDVQVLDCSMKWGERKMEYYKNECKIIDSKNVVFENYRYPERFPEAPSSIVQESISE